MNEIEVEPYMAMLWDSMWWMCGYCNDPIREIRDTNTSGKEYNPNFCPHCGAKVKK